jgi:arylsulfatase A-like enzyme
MDIAPTLLDLLDLPVPEAFRGRSFAGLLRGEPFPGRSIVSETSWRGIGLASLRRGRWKLIADRQTGTHRLFDLVADPGEHDDRSEAEPALLAELQNELDAALASGRSAAPDDTTGTGDPESESALEALGYFDDDDE